jgi:hypothetical protein
MHTFQSHPLILRDPFVKALSELIYIMSPLTNFDFCVFYHNDYLRRYNFKRWNDWITNWKVFGKKRPRYNSSIIPGFAWREWRKLRKASKTAAVATQTRYLHTDLVIQNLCHVSIATCEFHALWRLTPSVNETQLEEIQSKKCMVRNSAHKMSAPYEVSSKPANFGNQLCLLHRVDRILRNSYSPELQVKKKRRISD